MKKLRISQQSIVSALFIVMFAGFALFLPGFARVDNLLTLVQNVAILGILGLGMALVVIGRGIDISMIAALAVPSALLLQLVENGMPIGLACALAIGLSLLFGLVNGWLIAYAEVPSLFTTLASGLFLAGLGQAFLFQLEVVQWPEELNPVAWFGRGTLAGLPMPVVMFGAAAASVALFLRYLQAGALIYAIGDNPFAARATGLPSRPIVVLEYVLAALIGVFAGIVMAASVNSMPTRIYNSTMIYDVVLVVVLGGIGLSGGRGGVFNVIIGTLLIGTMLNGMTIMDMSYSLQNIVKGAVLLIAILIDSILNPRNEETAQQGDI
jgi:ribose transport system permease protein